MEHLQKENYFTLAQLETKINVHIFIAYVCQKRKDWNWLRIFTLGSGLAKNLQFSDAAALHSCS